MKHEFSTKQDAWAAGYRSINIHEQGVRDVSESPYFGYDYIDENGTKSVTVWLTDAINKGGKRGAFVAMFPPKQ